MCKTLHTEPARRAVVEAPCAAWTPDRFFAGPLVRGKPPLRPRSEPAIPVTDRQQRILEWLKKLFPHEALLFEGAIRLRADPANPCRARLVAHAYREICSGLANINGQDSRKLINELVEKLVRSAEALRPLLEQTPVSGADPRPKSRDPVSVPWEVLEVVRELIAAYSEQPKGAVRAQQLLDRLNGREARTDAEISPTASRWHRMARAFTGCCHDRNSDEAVLLAKLDVESEFLEETLISSVAEGAVDNLSALDEILGQTNE